MNDKELINSLISLMPVIIWSYWECRRIAMNFILFFKLILASWFFIILLFLWLDVRLLFTCIIVLKILMLDCHFCDYWNLLSIYWNLNNKYWILNYNKIYVLVNSVLLNQKSDLSNIQEMAGILAPAKRKYSYYF